MDELNERTAPLDPIELFGEWLREAEDAGIIEPNAMVIATVGEDGRPSARAVLLKGVDERGFVFYTNYDSRKGRELTMNPTIAAVFLWTPLRHQVRVEGHVERVRKEESDAYFATRPRESQIGAWASQQSAVIPSREVLERAVHEYERRFEGADVPRPPYWGGYRIVPEWIEFWQGRTGRLHDRLRYVHTDEGWRIERLSP